MFTGKTLLITGGTGSFGNAVLERFLDTNIAQIRVLSRDEKKQEDMRLRLKSAKVQFYIGDVRDYESLLPAIEGANYVFQAAALKQVPSCEFHPMEALKTNTIGTENVLNAAMRVGVEKFIALSSDKAVYPINAMGMSKALMEKIVIAKARLADPSTITLCCTRYGNVMASRGSVIPLFVQQLKRGNPLTVTDPNMTRFLMSLEDSVDLVLYAYKHGKQGDTFIKKAPASTIDVLATALMKIFEVDGEMNIIGTRHGEKLYETLVTREEMARADDLEGYFRVPYDDRSLSYTRYFNEGEPTISQSEDYNSHNSERLDVEGVQSLLLGLSFIKEELAIWKGSRR